MDKEDGYYVNSISHNEILFSHKKEPNFAICSNMDGLGSIMLSEISQREKDKYCMTSLICGI